MDVEVSFRIILEQPPAGVDFGLQHGKGSNYKTVQKQRSVTGDLKFEFTARIKNENTSSMDFLGPFVQGPRDARFVYIDIGSYAGQTNTEWSRRLKIPLSGIKAEMISKIQSDSGIILETKVPGTGKDGGPNCATVKPFEGWKLARR
jgi:hypothetical protein